MHTIGNRLRRWREHVGLSQKEAATRLSVPARTYQNYEMDVRAPGADAMECFVRGGINANWLLTDEGPMLLEERQRPDAPGPGQGEPDESHTTRKGLDVELMRELLELVEEELEQRDLHLPPANKARVLALMYDYVDKVGEADPAMLHNLLDLAA